MKKISRAIKLKQLRPSPPEQLKSSGWFLLQTPNTKKIQWEHPRPITMYVSELWGCKNISWVINLEVEAIPVRGPREKLVTPRFLMATVLFQIPDMRCLGQTWNPTKQARRTCVYEGRVPKQNPVLTPKELASTFLCSTIANWISSSCNNTPSWPLACLEQVACVSANASSREVPLMMRAFVSKV